MKKIFTFLLAFLANVASAISAKTLSQKVAKIANAISAMTKSDIA